MVSRTEGIDHIIPAHGNKSLLGKYGKDIERQNLLSTSMIHLLNVAKLAQEALTKVAQATLSNRDYVFKFVSLWDTFIIQSTTKTKL